MKRKNTLENFGKVIVTDEDNRPMRFDGEQFCYCTDSTWEDEHFALKVYRKLYANQLISKSRNFRKKNNFSITNYKMIPIIL